MKVGTCFRRPGAASSKWSAPSPLQSAMKTTSTPSEASSRLRHTRGRPLKILAMFSARTGFLSQTAARTSPVALGTVMRRGSL